MAETPEDRRGRRNALDLAFVRRDAADMEGVAAEWDALPLEERLSYDRNRYESVRKIDALAHEYDRGELTPDQRREFYALLRRLDALRPLIERMGLAWPRIDAYAVLLDPQAPAAAGR